MSRPSPLSVALVKLAEDGRRPRCGEPGGPELWLSEDADERAQAAGLCVGCSVLIECENAAKQHRVTFGTWAGVDRTRRVGGRRNA